MIYVLPIYGLIVLSLFGLIVRARGHRMVHAPVTFDETLMMVQVSLRQVTKVFAREIAPAFHDATKAMSEFCKTVEVSK